MSAKTREKKWDGKWRGFMDIPLTAETKEACKVWDGDGETLDGHLGNFMSGGYKFTAVWNEKSQSAVVSLTGTEAAGGNAGYTLTAHAKTVDQAVHVLAFKHVVLAEGNWHREGLYQSEEDFG